jgi:predicted membrane protein
MNGIPALHIKYGTKTNIPGFDLTAFVNTTGGLNIITRLLMVWKVAFSILHAAKTYVTIKLSDQLFDSTNDCKTKME